MTTAEATADQSHEAEQTAQTQVPELDERLARANTIIHRNVLWTLGAGLVPVPMFDLVAVTGVQLKMLRELTLLYNVPFNEGLVKKALASLVAGLGGVGIGAALAPSFAKFIPVIGTALGVVSVSIVSGAFTLATGRVFTMHFESGGTLLDFDPRAMREHFKREFEKAKVTVTQIKNEQDKAK